MKKIIIFFLFLLVPNLFFGECTCLDDGLGCQQWTPWLRVNGEGANSNNWTRIEAEAFIPLWQSEDTGLFFSYIRAAKYARSHLLDTSGGLGVRRLLCSNWIGGLNLSYDGFLSK